MRATLKVALVSIARAASAGIIPSSASPAKAPRLYAQPAAILVLFRPDLAHRRACVAFDQARAPGSGHLHAPMPTLDCTRKNCSGMSNPKALVQLIVKQPAPRLVRLKPLAVNHEL